MRIAKHLHCCNINCIFLSTCAVHVAVWSYPSFKRPYFTTLVSHWYIQRIFVSCIYISEEAAHGFVIDALLCDK